MQCMCVQGLCLKKYIYISMKKKGGVEEDRFVNSMIMHNYSS